MSGEKCPECPDEGLPGWMGTFADMMTLLFAFFVLMFSMATMDPAKLSDAGGDDIDVPYTHLTLPTILLVSTSEVAVLFIIHHFSVNHIYFL